MHGGTKRLKSMNDIAASFGKSPNEANRLEICAAVDAPSMFAATSPSVAVACSFAISADTAAAAPCQLPKPSGLRRHASQLPMSWRIDWSSCSSERSVNDQLKCITNHRKTHAGKIMSPALRM